MTDDIEAKDTQRGRGRPPHEPTDYWRGQVAAYVSYGVPHDDIAKIVGICADTLEKHYRHEIDTAVPMANAKIAQNLYRMASGSGKEAASCAMFWLKTRAFWKETQKMEHTGLDGKPIEVESKLQIIKEIMLLIAHEPKKE